MPNTRKDPGLEAPCRMRPGILLVLVATVILATTATFFGAWSLFERQTVSVAQSQKALYLRSLNETLKQHQHLPFILTHNPLIREKVARGEAQDLNEILHGVAVAANLEAVYVMSLAGDVLAASNFSSPSSFLGQNYSFRPYFQQAVRGTRSDYFAIGATTGRPGYFVAEPLRAASGDTIGIIAIKLDMSELQSAWVERGEQVLATNADGIVVLSADPTWLYRSVRNIAPDRRTEIVERRQFANETLAPLPWEAMPTGKVRVEDAVYYQASGQTDWRDWTVLYLTPEATVYRQTLVTTALLGSVIAALIGFATYLRSHRIAAALDTSLHHREKLIMANARLIETQQQLEHTSKLAALGHLAASVTHELGQPISALKNHLAAAEIGNEITSPETAENLRRIALRMEAITQQLRFFARAEKDEWHPVDLRAVIRGALSLLQHDFAMAGVVPHWIPSDSRVMVEGHEFQLEQCVVNLLRNALHAAAETGHPQVGITLRRTADHVTLRVTDNGPGLGGRTLDDLKEPFFSTKSSGVGMGLGLSITAEIVRAHAGDMSARDLPGGGAAFELTLRTAREVAP